jgi:hypothetical protein
MMIEMQQWLYIFMFLGMLECTYAPMAIYMHAPTDPYGVIFLIMYYNTHILIAA